LSQPDAQTGPEPADQARAATVSCCDEAMHSRDTVRCEHERPVVRHEVEGDLTIYTAAEQKARLLTVFRTPYSIIELNLRNVSEIDTAGLQLLILGCKVTVMVGGALRLTEFGPSVASMVDLLQLHEIFARAQNHCPHCAADRIRNHV
jgi:anti-sigma B factor antagonist